MYTQEPSFFKFSFLIISRFILFILIGIILNSIFIYYLVPSIRAIMDIPDENSSVLYHALFLIIGSCIVGFFLLIMPLVYGWVGKRYVTRLILFKVLFKHKNWLIDWILQTITLSIGSQVPIRDAFEQKKWKKVVSGISSDLSSRLKKQRLAIRLIGKFILRKKNSKKLERLFQYIPVGSSSATLTQEQTIQMDLFFKEIIPFPTFRLFIIVLSLNTCMFVLLKICF